MERHFHAHLVEAGLSRYTQLPAYLLVTPRDICKLIQDFENWSLIFLLAGGEVPEAEPDSSAVCAGFHRGAVPLEGPSQLLLRQPAEDEPR